MMDIDDVRAQLYLDLDFWRRESDEVVGYIHGLLEWIDEEVGDDGDNGSD